MLSYLTITIVFDVLAEN